MLGFDCVGSDFKWLCGLLLGGCNDFCFQPNAKSLFNFTILTYFFKNFAGLKGEISVELVDENLRTDIGWLRRLTITLENAQEMLDALVIGKEVFYSPAALRRTFNGRKACNEKYYPSILYYFGIVTFAGHYTMHLPNKMMQLVASQALQGLEVAS